MSLFFKKNKLLIWGAIFLVLIIFYLILSQLTGISILPFLNIFTEKQFWIYALVGFCAQMIDGALGMAYGVSSTTFLLSAGVSPATASASVHIAEIFTSGMSGLAHHRMGNVNKKLFRNLVIPGVIGGILGAFLSTRIDGKVLTPYIASYLLIMGVIIIFKAFRKKVVLKKKRKLFRLALFGGFCDSIGGGGWGPIVNSTLLGSGHTPRYAIGSVNLAEFFVAFFTAFSFIVFLGLKEWNNLQELSSIILGLIFGGVFAAPFAAIICKKLKAKTLMIIVGSLIIMLSCKTLFF